MANVIDVLVDGRALSDEHSKHRGIGVFVRSLLTALADAPDLSASALVAPETALPDRIGKIDVHRWRSHRFTVQEHSLRLWFDVRRVAPDVFHSPALEPPVACPRPWVQTLHDLTPLVYDHPLFERERRHWTRTFRRMRNAAIVAAVSRYTADTAVRVLGLDPGRVHVVPHGIDPRLRPPANRTQPDPPFLLYVGVFGPHKGYPEAFRLISELAERGYPHRLKIVGTLNAWRKEQIDRLLSACKHPERVDLVGFVDDDELRTLYSSATALVMTSRCEGFGLPAIEGMAVGAPVVAFDNTAVGEVVGDGGTLVPDGDVPTMAENVARLIDDSAAWRRSSEQGIHRSRSFDWATAASRYVELYRVATSA